MEVDLKQINEKLEKLDGVVGALATKSDVDGARAALEETKGALTTVQGENEKLAVQITEMRALLRTLHGKSGADDWRKTFGKFLCGAYHFKTTGRVREDCKIDGFDYGEASGEEFRKNYTVGTAASAGSLLPTTVLPGLMALRQVIGVIIPKCMNLVIPPMASVVVNSDSVLPTAAWVNNSGTITEGYALVDQTTFAISSETLKPMLIGSTSTIQAELLNFPGIGFAELYGVRMMEAIIAKEEVGILGGTVATTYPSEGVISTTGVNAQTALATATVQNLLTFLGECAADQASAVDTSRNMLFITPARYFALAGQAVGSNVGAALAWANPKEGIPPILFGYPIIQHPGALVSTTHSVVLGDPSTIVFGNSGQIAVDFNPYATGTNTGWLANNVWMRAMTHSDWVVGAPKAWHKATITA